MMLFVSVLNLLVDVCECIKSSGRAKLFEYIGGSTISAGVNTIPLPLFDMMLLVMSLLLLEASKRIPSHEFEFTMLFVMLLLLEERNLIPYLLLDTLLFVIMLLLEERR